MSPNLPACPDRCGGRAVYLATDVALGHAVARYRCTRCGEVWWVTEAANAQGSLFDPAEGERLRDAGMARAAGAEGEDWATWARWAIIGLAAHRESFTADDLARSAELQARWPAHHNAIGAAVNAAARAGLITTTGETVQTDRASGHRRRLLVWRGASL